MDIVTSSFLFCVRLNPRLLAVFHHIVGGAPRLMPDQSLSNAFPKHNSPTDRVVGGFNV